MDIEGTEILGALGLDWGARVLLDSSALIAYIEGSGDAKATMDAVVAAAGSQCLKLGASAIAWTEVLRARLPADLALAYRRFLSDSTLIVIVPVDVAIAYAAAGLLSALDRREGTEGQSRMAAPKAFFADAIHLATAVTGRYDAVLTNDEAWKAAAPPRLRVILLDELAAVYSNSR